MSQTNPESSKKIIKIAIVGPECTGKSTLSASLAAHYQTLWVPEYARLYLNQLQSGYQQSDLLAIAKGQLQMEDVLLKQGSKLIFCDTNLLVIKIWSQYKYNSVDQKLLELWRPQDYTHHLLNYIDVNWEYDPLRENPNNRAELFEIYRKELLSLNIPFTVIKGSELERLNQAIAVVDQILES